MTCSPGSGRRFGMGIAKRFLFAIPALALLAYVVTGVMSLVFSEGVRLQRVGEHLADPELWYTVGLTLKVSFLALFLSWVFAWLVLVVLKGRGIAVFRFFSVLPGMAYALFVLLVLRAVGAESPYSMGSVLIAWVLAGTLYLCSGISEGIRDLGPRGKEALRTLGAGPVRAFFHHEFSGTRALQGALLLQQLWFFLTSFSLVMILGGGPPSETLEVAIYSAMRLGQSDVSKAVALSLVQALILILLRFSLNRLGSAKPARGISEGFGKSGKKRSSRGISVVILFCLGGLVFLVPKVGDARAYLRPLFVTLALGASVVGATLLFSISSYVSGIRFASVIGSWCSPLFLSLALWSFSGFLISPFVNVALIQTLFFAPWFSQIVFPLLDRAQRSEMEAARVLGAGRIRAFFEVEWPRIRGGVIRVLGLVFALSATEVSSVLLFSRGDFDTLASHSQNLFSRFRIEEAAFGVMAMLLLSAVSLGLGERRA